jgi:hypothetical protein
MERLLHRFRIRIVYCFASSKNNERLQPGGPQHNEFASLKRRVFLLVDEAAVSAW